MEHSQELWKPECQKTQLQSFNEGIACNGKCIGLASTRRWRSWTVHEHHLEHHEEHRHNDSSRAAPSVESLGCSRWHDHTAWHAQEGKAKTATVLFSLPWAWEMLNLNLKKNWRTEEDNNEAMSKVNTSPWSQISCNHSVAFLWSSNRLFIGHTVQDSNAILLYNISCMNYLVILAQEQLILDTTTSLNPLHFTRLALYFVYALQRIVPGSTSNWTNSSMWVEMYSMCVCSLECFLNCKHVLQGLHTMYTLRNPVVGLLCWLQIFCLEHLSPIAICKQQLQA